MNLIETIDVLVTLDSSDDDDEPDVASEKEDEDTQIPDQNAQRHGVSHVNDVRPNAVPDYLGVAGVDHDINLPEDAEEGRYAIFHEIIFD